MVLLGLLTLNEIMHIKCFLEYLAHDKHSTNINISMLFTSYRGDFNKSSYTSFLLLLFDYMTVLFKLLDKAVARIINFGFENIIKSVGKSD